MIFKNNKNHRYAHNNSGLWFWISVVCEYGLGLRLCVSLNDIMDFLYTLCKGIRSPDYVSVNL